MDIQEPKKHTIGLGDLLELAAEKISAEEIIKETIKPFGFGAAHITKINPEHIGKKCTVIIHPDKKQEEKKS